MNCVVTTDTPGRGPAFRLWQRIEAELKRRFISQRQLADLANEYLRQEHPRGVPEDLKVEPMHLTRLRSTAPRLPKDRVRRRAQVRAIAAVLDIPEQEALELAGLVAPTSATVNDAIAAITRVDGRELTDDQKRSVSQLLEDMRDLNARARGELGYGETTHPDTA